MSDKPLTDHGLPEKGQRLVWDNETSSFKPGKAKPALLDPELRKLPGELVTKELEDGTKIHELDPSHIRGALQEEFAENQAKAEKRLNPKERFEALLNDPASALGEVVRRFVVPGPEANLGDCRLTPERVDWNRFQALRQKVKSAVELVANGDADVNVAMKWLRCLQHVWFPQDDIRISEIREGRAPPDRDRPRRLKGLTLEVDVFNWPVRVVDLFKLAGVQVPDFNQIERDLEYAASLLAYTREPEDGEED